MKKLLLGFLFSLVTITTNAQITTPFGLFTGCRPTSITLNAPSGYSSYLWSTGATTSQIDYTLVGSGGQILDTATVELTCFDSNGNAFPQTPVVVRSVREPKVVDAFNKIYNYSLTDSIKSDLVLTYLTAPEYVFTFTQTDSKVNGLEVVSTYVSNNRWCYLNQMNPPLIPGKFYHITVHARIDGNDYCPGNYAEIGIAPDSSVVTSLSAINYNPLDVEIYPNPSKDRFQLVIDSDIKTSTLISIYDIRGRLMYTNEINQYPFYDNVGEFLNSGIYKMVVMQNNNIKSYNLEKM